MLHSLKILPTRSSNISNSKKSLAIKTDHQEMKKICGQWAVHQNLALEVMPIENIMPRILILENLSEPLATSSSEPENQKSCLLILDGLEDLQNIGAILRRHLCWGLMRSAGGWQENAHLARAAAGGVRDNSIVRI